MKSFATTVLASRACFGSNGSYSWRSSEHVSCSSSQEPTGCFSFESALFACWMSYYCKTFSTGLVLNNLEKPLGVFIAITGHVRLVLFDSS